MPNTPIEILIEVSGGCATVVAATARVKVHLIDHDLAECGDHTKEDWHPRPCHPYEVLTADGFASLLKETQDAYRASLISEAEVGK